MFWRRTRPRDRRPAGPRIIFIGRSGCHLCDEAEAVVAAVAEESGVGWVKRLVDEDPDLLARWGDQVPVTLVDGQPHDYYRVSAQRLRLALRR